MSASSATVLESVLHTLLAEEAGLQELVVLALQEQEALITSDFETITRVSAAMLEAARHVDDLERERAALLGPLGASEAALDQLLPMAIEAGVPGFDEVRTRLFQRARQLRDAQEQNARLVLSAIKLQERWLAMFSSLASPTYSADGSQDRQARHQIMSRSA